MRLLFHCGIGAAFMLASSACWAQSTPSAPPAVEPPAAATTSQVPPPAASEAQASPNSEAPAPTTSGTAPTTGLSTASELLPVRKIEIAPPTTAPTNGEQPAKAASPVSPSPGDKKPEVVIVRPGGASGGGGASNVTIVRPGDGSQNSSVTVVRPGVNRIPLAPEQKDALDIDEVMLEARQVAVVSGESPSTDLMKVVPATIARMEKALSAIKIDIRGFPLALFIETREDSFRYDIMIPVEGVPTEQTSIPGTDIRFGRSPAGKALRFVYKGPYSSIDTAYSSIANYLDDKGIYAQDVYIEEYLAELKNGGEDNLSINIYVQPK